MKKVLVTGVNSYVGNSFAEWVKQYPYEYDVDRISVRDDRWKSLDLSVYDSILHVAGIAHRKETKKNTMLYYNVNRDLACELANKAKSDGVKHFIFLSTMSVYGLDVGMIDKDTPLKPKSHYGKSKLLAEEKIKRLEDYFFKVAILRPPMVYGKGCKGNYQRLRKLALKIPVFPDVNNKRSMIYIDNLSEFIRNIINELENGVFYPQNKEYVNTSELVKLISNLNNRKIILTRLFNPIVYMLNSNIRVSRKVFGSLFYDESLCVYKKTYQIDSFSKSIMKIEKGNCKYG